MYEKDMHTKEKKKRKEKNLLKFLALVALGNLENGEFLLVLDLLPGA